jgi:hypothetical protein
MSYQYMSGAILIIVFGRHARVVGQAFHKFIIAERNGVILCIDRKLRPSAQTSIVKLYSKQASSLRADCEITPFQTRS